MMAMKRDESSGPSGLAPPQGMGKEELINMYRCMYYMRRFEMKTAKMYLELKIGGFAHLYIGQEAVAAGAIGELRPDDFVMSNYRDHCHYLMKGGDPNLMMAELFGKQTGLCKGKGGSMHLFDLDLGFLGGYAIVGAGLPVALGVAYAMKYRESDRIVMVFFGDGATNTGAFYETVNMAKLWSLPLLFVCENNLWGIGTGIERVSAVTDLYNKAESHGIPGKIVDGMDVFAVKEATEKAVQHLRSGKGPYFIEARTWRFRGHSMTDHDQYRTKEAKEEWRAKDPVLGLRGYLLDTAGASDAEIAQVEEQVQQSINAAAEFADESADPPPEALYEDVYA